MIYRAPSNQDEGDLDTGTRVCRVCDSRKPMAAFYRTADRRHRVRTCSTCLTAQARTRREQNREDVAKRSFETHLRNTYGMTKEDFESLWEAQDGRCAVCHAGFKKRRPHVDHNHQTGAVRGLLCFTCNTAIGKMRDDPALLRAAAAYLESPLPPIRGRSRKLTLDERREIRSKAAAKAHSSPKGQVHLRMRPKGEHAFGARLNDQQAQEIRARYEAGGISQRMLAEEYGCSQSHVSKIVRGVLRAVI
ncbi:endonuclease domain-containing protein [Nonomuraea basaltis]|uniref:endonuclease domain-containing protein n=1 Tax=Nonomuraea basaltis TaxID=2495887 RepID=UPI00110C6817|nr:endonuclease domain-containing protein [Nonomuraea basaltis]TMR97331.1 helix-turn-helix domain-containing protein [Nonomuraea basaltis]